MTIFAPMTKDEKTLLQFRRKLAATLKRRGLTQIRASQITGVTPSQICRILKGANPRYTDAVRLQELDAE